MEPITIRGHHLFDMLGALATGQSPHKTLGPVAARIRQNPDTPLRVVVGVDDICSPCEWWDHAANGCRRNRETYPEDNRNSFLSDENAIRVLGLTAGEVVPALELYRRIQEKVSPQVFAEEVCVACRLVNQCKEHYAERIRAVVEALSGRST